MPEKISREQLTKNYRRGAVNYLFMYLYVLHQGRVPEGWEIGLARSLLISDVVFLSEPESEDIKRVHNLVLEVDRAMNLVEKKSLSFEAENSKNFFIPCKDA